MHKYMAVDNNRQSIRQEKWYSLHLGEDIWTEGSFLSYRWVEECLIAEERDQRLFERPMNISALLSELILCLSPAHSWFYVLHPFLWSFSSSLFCFLQGLRYLSPTSHLHIYIWISSPSITSHPFYGFWTK